MKYLLALLSLLVFLAATDQAEPYFSSIVPYSGYEPVEIRSLTNQNELPLMRDNDPNTFWESAAQLPTGWIGIQGVNFHIDAELKNRQNQVVQGSNKAFDGDLDTAVDLAATTEYFKRSRLSEANELLLKIGVKSDLKVEFIDKENQTVFTKIFTAEDNYKPLIIKGVKADVRKLKFSSSDDWQLFELAKKGPVIAEKVLVDLGKVVSLKYLELLDNRKEEGIEKLLISTSKGKEGKVGVRYIDINENFIEFKSEVKARYVLLTYILTKKDWQKVRIAELKLYDRNGKSGPKPNATQSKNTLKELLGINAYWGFGHDKYSKFAPKGEAAEAFAPFFSHFRNYHDMTWDVDDPDSPVDYRAMAAGRGTPAKDWLNWDTEYLNWKETGVDLQVSLQMARFKDTEWDKPQESAYNYAYAFARHFGPTHGNATVSSIEVGNEPWTYQAHVYREILIGMARGIKDADPAIEIFPCALQAADPEKENNPHFKNYINARIPKEVLPLLDGINVHHYSFNTHNVYTQKAMQPEAAGSVFWEISDAIKWRNKNLPDKKIYLSEWGWDSAGGGEDCSHRQCVQEEDAAAFAVRGALIAHRLGMDRATWFFYGNEPGKSRLYARSGLLSSAEAGFQRKKTYYALKHLLEKLGDQHFVKVYKEANDYWGYYYGDASGKPKYLLLWRPVIADERKINVTLRPPLKPTKAEVFNFSEEVAFKEVELTRQGNNVQVKVGFVPVLITLE